MFLKALIFYISGSSPQYVTVASAFATAVDIPHPALASLGFSQLLLMPVQSPGDLSPKGGQISYFASVAGTEALMI